jgi:hypothetical protein
MDRVRTFDARCRKSAASDNVDADGQYLPRRIKIDTAHVPRFADAERRFEQLVLPIRGRLLPSLNARTMPTFRLARLSSPAVAVKGSLRRASPALDRAHGTPLPNPLVFQKRQVRTFGILAYFLRTYITVGKLRIEHRIPTSIARQRHDARGSPQQPDRANFDHGRPPPCGRFDTTTVRHFDAGEQGPSTS